MRDFDEYNEDEFEKQGYEGEPFDEPDNLGAMGLFDHLEELRWCVARTFIAVIICFPIGLYFVDDFINFCASLSKVESLAAFNPAEIFLQRFRVALQLSLFVCLPYVLLQVWSFVSPGLYEKERKWAGYSVLASYLFFATGALFGLFIIAPMALDFFHGLQMEAVKNVLRLSDTITFVVRIAIAMGVVLQLPIIVVLLNVLGVVEIETVKNSRSYVVVGIFILSMLLTPPDVISQVMLAVPTCILFELAILFCRFLATDPEVRERNKKRNLMIAVTALLVILGGTSFGIYRVYQIKSGQLFDQSLASVKSEDLAGMVKQETGQAKLLAMLDYHNTQKVTIEDEQWQELLKQWQEGALTDELKAKMVAYAFSLEAQILQDMAGKRSLNVHIKQKAHVPIKLQALWEIKLNDQSYFWPGMNNQYRYDQSLGVLEKLSRLNVLNDLPRLEQALTKVGEHQLALGLKVTQAQDLTDKSEILYLDELMSKPVEWAVKTTK